MKNYVVWFTFGYISSLRLPQPIKAKSEKEAVTTFIEMFDSEGISWNEIVDVTEVVE